MKYGEELPGLTWVNENSFIYGGIKTKLTPWIEQYLDAKRQNPDALLLFRMGDFYETFFDDAKVIARALDLTLTSRSKNEEGVGLPMAGVPHRTINEYLFSLVEQGFRVAVCDQLEDPATAQGTIVKRGITQIVTPGTLCDDRPGYDRNARFLSGVFMNTDKSIALANLDLSTGYCTMTEVSNIQELASELQRVNVREIVTHDTQGALDKAFTGIPVEVRPRAIFSQTSLLDHWKSCDESETLLSKEKFLTFLASIEDTGFRQPDGVISAFCGILMYLVELHYKLTSNIEQVYPYRAEAFMQIDASTFQNLEIYATLRGGGKKGSLLGELDETVTSGGARLMQNWLAYPLKDVKQITARLDAVENMYNDVEMREALRGLLNATGDLERLTTKIANDRIMPRELVMLKTTLRVIPEITKRCSNAQAKYFRRAATQLNPLVKLADEIDRAIVEDAPSNLNDTNFFNPGYDEELDKYRELDEHGAQWLLNYEAKQRTETGITSLKVKYHRVFGYFIEVPKSKLSGVPESYIRSQTLTNADRFYTPELKEYEENILNAKSKRGERELELFADIKMFAAHHIPMLMRNARILAHIDVLTSLAYTAHHRNYTRPLIDETRAFVLNNARHPVVERFLPKGERFVPNDIELGDNSRFMVITGPNMAGKSTIIRQAAIITLMAQMGSFVPAEAAHIGCVDRIFSRVGASDNLALGQSTFMVEMTETANILKNATANSLVILDEIGRGTSTYDGLSLAWSITEYLHTKVGARTLFATHYHELTELENVLPGIQNASIAVKEYDKDIIFLRKLIRGAASRSYGIEVARLAGIPKEVIDRAESILKLLEQNAHGELVRSEAGKETASKSPKSAPQNPRQLFSQRSLFSAPEPEKSVSLDPNTEAFLEAFYALSLDTTSPIQALNWLYKWQKKLHP